jgi:hypothetical protein
LSPPERPTFKTTLYPLRNVTAADEGLRGALSNEYLQDRDVTISSPDIPSCSALLINGTTDCARADWCSIVSGLTGEELEMGYSHAGCALLIAVDDDVFALTYGTVIYDSADTDIIVSMRHRERRHRDVPNHH